MYLYGLPEFTVITDHKPLLPQYNNFKANMPPRILKHKLYLQGYKFHLEHEPGISNPADYLSRHPAELTTQEERKIETEKQINAIVRDNIPAAVTMERMQQATEKDETLQRLAQSVRQGYITKEDSVALKQYKNILDEILLAEKLLLRGAKIIVPETLQKEIVTLAREGHQGMERTKQYLRTHMWFPAMAWQRRKWQAV
jgi:hypothetical protein